jgi:cytoskeletal protein CcmA (bactofilin family)
VTPATTPAQRPLDESVVAADDRIEGKIRTSRGMRILGTVDGHIESDSHVHIEQTAKVTADITAEEVVIAGSYSGKLICRQRLEVQPTGRVNGSIETVKLMLHEGGFVDGELHMQKPPTPEVGSSSSSEASRPGESTLRPVGSIRSTVEPSVRAGAPAAATASSSSSDGESSDSDK